MGSPPTPNRLLDQVCNVLRLRHYPWHTEPAYVGWITRCVLIHDERHPRDMGMSEVEAFRITLYQITKDKPGAAEPE